MLKRLIITTGACSEHAQASYHMLKRLIKCVSVYRNLRPQRCLKVYTKGRQSAEQSFFAQYAYSPTICHTRTHPHTHTHTHTNTQEGARRVVLIDIMADGSQPITPPIPLALLQPPRIQVRCPACILCVFVCVYVCVCVCNGTLQNQCASSCSSSRAESFCPICLQRSLVL